ncbi:MAG: glycosyltransferase family 2 protein [Acidobacteria bacterium]|nr:glycosyltransferase family 2 protein [Acidobacteriota bacterium]
MISVIIVTYNSERHIARCLESLAGKEAEVVVVDNASSDATADRVRKGFPGVKCMSAPHNLGFAGAANLGVRHSAGSALLFLNPDTVCLGPFRLLEEVLESRPEAVAVAPQLVDAAGRPQVGFNLRRLPTAASLIFEVLLLNRLFPNNPVNRRYRCLDLDPQRPAEVEQPAGACLLVRRSSFEQCGGFDEGFFPLWFEDVDLCRRLLQGGGKILYCPQVQVQHQGGHSVETLSFSEKQIYWYRNLLYYVQKGFSWRAGLGVRAALVCGVGFRMMAEVINMVLQRQTPSQIRAGRLRAYWEAARLSFSGWR